MTWTLIEGAIDAVRDYLIANLDAKLTALNAEYDDGITLGPMANTGEGVIFHVGPKTLESLQLFPVGFILGGETQVGYWNNTNTDGGHSLVIAVMDQDQDTEVLMRKIYRFERAIWECLVAGHFASALSGFKIIGTPRMDSSPVLTQTSMSLSEARVTVNVVKQETRS